MEGYCGKCRKLVIYCVCRERPKRCIDPCNECDCVIRREPCRCRERPKRCSPICWYFITTNITTSLTQGVQSTIPFNNIVGSGSNCLRSICGVYTISSHVTLMSSSTTPGYVLIEVKIGGATISQSTVNFSGANTPITSSADITFIQQLQDGQQVSVTATPSISGVTVLTAGTNLSMARLSES